MLMPWLACSGPTWTSRYRSMASCQSRRPLVTLVPSLWYPRKWEVPVMAISCLAAACEQHPGWEVKRLRFESEAQ